MAGMSKFVIVLGGDVTPTPRLSAQVAGARVIAADSGMAHVVALGLSAELWVGDFDSAGSALEDRFKDVPRHVFPAAKDKTDGEIAVDEALKRGATELVLVGAFGGQFDHALAHATQLLALAQQGMTAFATSGNEEAWPLLGHLSLWQMRKGTRISIVGLSDLTALSVTGVRWPLHRQDVGFGSTLTLSNEATGDVMITLENGRAVVLVYPGGTL
jgi:thiamine pyrophosphokinase